MYAFGAPTDEQLRHSGLYSLGLFIRLEDKYIIEYLNNALLYWLESK